jgi:hypothetical protein
MSATAQLWDLWSRFVAGDRLTDEQERRLADALEADPELRRAALGDHGFHAALAELGRAQRAPEAHESFAARVEKLVLADADADAFAGRVARRLADATAARARRLRLWAAALAVGTAAAAAVVVVFHRPPPVAPIPARPGALATVAVKPAAVPAPSVVPAPLPSPPPAGEVVYRFEGRAPKLIGHTPDRCPPRPGGDGRHCVAGVLFSERLRSLTVRLGDKHGLFAYADDQVLVFDYWIGAWTGERAPRFEVTLRALHRPGADFKFRVNDPRPAVWQTAVVPLGDLRDSKAGPDDRLHPGDRVVLMKFVTDSGTQDVLYVDDLRVLQRQGANRP